MRELDPKIDLHIELYNQIYKALQGDVMDAIRISCGDDDHHRLFQRSMVGRSFKVEESTLPEFYNLCGEVMKKLGYEGKIDFYITSNADVNACAMLACNDDEPSVIEINSGLFNLMTEDEIRFVIGHEIGHLLNRDSEILKLIDFVYPTNELEEERCPQFVKVRKVLFNNVAELSADRYGYMANENLEASITAIYKLSSGLYLHKLGVNLNGLLNANHKFVDMILGENGVRPLGGTHPMHPLRIQALEHFVNCKTQKALTQGMQRIIEHIQEFVLTPVHNAKAYFNAAAGIMMAQADGKKDRYEESFIQNQVAQFTLYPHKLIKEVEKGVIAKEMEESAAFILEHEPDAAVELLGYLVEVALLDQILDTRELGIIYEFASAKLGLPEQTISRFIATKVRECFVPQAVTMK